MLVIIPLAASSDTKRPDRRLVHLRCTRSSARNGGLIHCRAGGAAPTCPWLTRPIWGAGPDRFWDSGRWAAVGASVSLDEGPCHSGSANADVLATAEVAETRHSRTESCVACRGR